MFLAYVLKVSPEGLTQARRYRPDCAIKRVDHRTPEFHRREVAEIAEAACLSDPLAF